MSELSFSSPTPTHQKPPTQEIPRIASAGEAWYPGWGVVPSDHVVPSQLTTMVAPVPMPCVAWPTSTHEVGPKQSTAEGKPSAGGCGFGTDCTFHVVPFHCSTRLPLALPVCW